jgi:hypothetical protein
MKWSAKTGGNKTILVTLENNILKWYGNVIRMQNNIASANNDLVIGRKTKTGTTGSEVGKGNWEGYEAEKFNIWRRNQAANIATENGTGGQIEFL